LDNKTVDMSKIPYPLFWLKEWFTLFFLCIKIW
jgi:hypothetical protein